MSDKFGQIKELCLKETGKNPIEIAVKLMKLPGISIHGPEHHVLDGAALLTALHNAGLDFDLESALEEMEIRGGKMPGATCGQWGICGSCASAGAALAIIHGTGPLSDNEYYKDNMRLTSKALARIGEIGGPRCCKRNGFLSLLTAAEFVRERYGIDLETQTPKCVFSSQNSQCIGSRCPFYQGER